MPRLDDYSLRYKGIDGIVPVSSLTNQDLVMTGTGLICTLAGRDFSKVNAGWALVGYTYVSGVNYTGPLLVSTVLPYVTYYPAGFSNIDGSGSYITYKGVNYYYSGDGAWMINNITDSSGLGKTKVTADTFANAALDLVKRFYYDGY